MMGFLLTGVAARHLLKKWLGAPGMGLARSRRYPCLSAHFRSENEYDLAWIGNWGDDERTQRTARVFDQAGS